MEGLSAIINLRQISEFEFEATVPETWGQGRAAYGGIPGALTLEATRQTYNRPVRSLSLNFVGPLETGPVKIQLRTLREGKSATHCAVDLLQHNQVVSASLLVLGDNRDSAVEYESLPAPQIIPPEQAVSFGYIPGITPEFTNHFDYRWTAPHWPFSGGEPHVQGWCRPKVGTSSGTPLVAALLDAWPPPVWNVVTSPFPGSSISWFISFQPPAHRTDIPLDAWWIYNSTLQSSHNGYAHFEANIWNCHGEHVAISRQIFAEFSKKIPVI